MTQRLDSLQALRGVACLAVVGFHAAQQEARFGLGFNPLGWLQWVGYAGVDLFFVLSGVLIVQTARVGFGRPSQLPGYLFRRAWRIYPTYWIAMLIAAGLIHILIGTIDHVLPTDAPEWFLFPRHELPKLLPVAWTLRYELMFYVAVGCLYLTPRRAAGPLLATWAAVVLLWSITKQPPTDPFAAHALNPLILEFLFGAAIGLVGVPVGRVSAMVLVAVATLWAAIGLALHYSPDPLLLAHRPLMRVLVFGPSAALLVAAGVSWDRAGGKPLPRWIRSVGDASYSIYLIHIPIQIQIMFAAMRTGWPHDRLPHLAWAVVMLVVPVIAGYAMYRLIERPILRLGRRSQAKPAQRPATGTEVVHPTSHGHVCDQRRGHVRLESSVDH